MPLPAADELVARLAARGIVLPPGPVRVDAYGDSPELSASLLALIRQGRKRAGTSLLWAHEADQEPVPQVGQIEIVVDHRDEPALVTRVVRVEVLPYGAVGAEYAAIEGEGDGSLDYWRSAHWSFFSRECRRLGRQPAEEMPVVCSVFELLEVLPPHHDEVLRFWFDEIAPAQWWRADPAFDAAIAQRFGALHAAALLGELSAWRHDPRGRLAEVIVLDQFSRNLHRGTARAFAGDAMALALAQEAVAGGHDAALPPQQRSFLYMPFVHSESPVVHLQAKRLFETLGLPESLRSALEHKAIVDRFGRYPHRNAVLGRVSTDEELAFLRQPGSRF